MRRPAEQCRLCHEIRQLCQSHIIPEFCYASLYDREKRAFAMARRGGAKARLLQKGLWEYLLCEECEAKLNASVEAYFQRAWFDEGRFERSLTLGPFEVAGLDVARFRLFHLSVLWRASVSTKGLFAGVKLAPRFEEQIRQMLLAGDGTVAWGAHAFTADGLILEDKPFYAISDAQKIRFNPAVALYAMMYAGCVWLFYVASYTPPEIAGRVLERGGIMPVIGHDVFDYFMVRKPARSAKRVRERSRGS